MLKLEEAAQMYWAMAFHYRLTKDEQALKGLKDLMRCNPPAKILDRVRALAA